MSEHGESGKNSGTVVNGFIGKGVTISGKLSFDGILRIDGLFTGEIDAPGTLVVGVDGVVGSRIKVGNAFISGEVRGVIEAVAKVELLPSCRVYGDIITPKLVIGEGALFEGNCFMNQAPDSAPRELPMEDVLTKSS